MGTIIGMIIVVPMAALILSARIPDRIDNFLFARRGSGMYCPGVRGPWWLGGSPYQG
jgi:hypothetical protein